LRRVRGPSSVALRLLLLNAMTTYRFPVPQNRNLPRLPRHRCFGDWEATPSERFFGESLDAPSPSQQTPSQAFFGESLERMFRPAT